MTNGTAIAEVLRAGLSLHGLAVLDPSVAVPAPARTATIPLSDWHRLAAGQLAPTTGQPTSSRFVLEAAGLLRGPDGRPAGYAAYAEFARKLAPHEVAEHLFGDALRRETLRDDVQGFSEEFYRGEYAKAEDLVRTGAAASLLEQYVRHGAARGNNPNAAFRERYYLQRYPDVGRAVEQGSFVSGFHHFLAAGRREGRCYRPPERLAAVDLTHFATPAADGAFAAMTASLLGAILRLLRGVQFVLLLPEGLYDLFSPWDAENVRRQVVPATVRRPAPELLNLHPDCLLSFGRPSLFRGEERARLTVTPDPGHAWRLTVSAEAAGMQDHRGCLAFAGPLDGLVCTLDGDRPTLPFAAQAAIRDDSFGWLVDALRQVFAPAGPFLQAPEIVGLDEHGDMGVRAYVHVGAEAPGTVLAVVLHCPEGRPRQELAVRVRDAARHTVSERRVVVSPGYRLWQEVDLPVGPVQVEFQALTPQKVIVDERWRSFVSVRFAETRLRQTAEVRLVNQAAEVAGPGARPGSEIDRFEFLAACRGGAHARDVFDMLGRLSKSLPAYRPRMRRFRWQYDLVRRPRFLVVSGAGEGGLDRRWGDRRIRCLLDWAGGAGFETELRESDFASGWFRDARLGVNWRTLDCCVLVGPSVTHGLAEIRDINEDLILLTYRTGAVASPPRPGWPGRLRAAVGRRSLRRARPDHEFLDHLAVLRQGRFVVDAPDGELAYLPSYPPAPAPAGQSTGDARRCGIYVTSAQVLQRALRTPRWVRSLDSLRAANPGWSFCLVAGDAGGTRPDPSAGVTATGMQVLAPADLQASPGCVRALLFWEPDPGGYLDLLVEAVAQSVTCIVDTSVRARLSRELYVHTASVTMPQGMLAAVRLDDLVFAFDGSQFVADLERIFHRNLGEAFNRVSGRRFGEPMRTLPDYWAPLTG